MIKDYQEAKRILGTIELNDEDVNHVFFLNKRIITAVIDSTRDKRVASIAKEKLNLIDSVYHDGGMLQENSNPSMGNDEKICSQIREYMVSNHFNRSEIEQRISLLSQCNNAESKYLAALLLLKVDNDYDSATRALSFISQAYAKEPYNPLYEDFYMGLKDNLKDINDRNQRIAEERRRAAEEQKRRAEQEIYERERRIAERQMQEEKEKRKKIIWTISIIIAICACAVSCS